MSNAKVVVHSVVSPGPAPNCSAKCATALPSAAWPTSVPLGRPVEPEVYIRYAQAPGSTATGPAPASGGASSTGGTTSTATSPAAPSATPSSAASSTRVAE